jgi:hypothetical protein
MLPGADKDESHLGLGQRWAYLSGALQWYGDLLALLFFVFLLVGSANVALGAGLVFRKLTGFLLAAIPLLVALGLLRAVALLRRGTGATWREAFGAFFIWQSTGLTTARASVQALFAKEAVFLRTPKTHDEPDWTDALRGNWAECLCGLLGLAAIAGALAHAASYSGALLAALLIWPTMSFLAAPYNSVSAQRAALPPHLRERRRTEQLRYGARRLGYAAGGLGLAGGIAAVAMGLFAPTPASITPPQLIGPARGQPVRYGPPAQSSPRSPGSPATRRRHLHRRGSTTTTGPSTTTTATTPRTTTTTTTTPTSTATTPSTTTSTPSTTTTTPAGPTTLTTTSSGP